MKVHKVLRLPRNLRVKRRCPADARAYIRPLGKQQAPHTVHMEVYKVLCLPRDLHTEVHKGLRLPRNLHMKVHKVLRLPRNLHIKRRCPADARAYIRPLGKQQAPHTVHLEVHKVLCLPRDGGSQSTAPATKSAHEGSQSAGPATKSAHQAPVPSRRQGVHPTPWQATPGRTSDPSASSKALCLQVLRLPRNLHIKRQCPADARAYVRPLGKQQAPHTARKCYRPSAGAQPTPGRTSDPWASSKVLCLPRDLHTEAHKVLRLPRNLHMKVHKVLGLPRNLHIKRRCPADARAYIRPLGRQQSTNWTAYKAPGRQKRINWTAWEAPGGTREAGKDCP